MNLIWCCVFALIAITHAAVDVEKTVRQVQTILQANQQLPRLTRDEILQLLNDIRSEDSKSASKESKEENKKDIINSTYSTIENEINPQEPNIEDNIVIEEKPVSTTVPSKIVETTTKKNEPTLMVVLPYTPRDGASLQELYTRPPRVEVVHISSTTTRPTTTKPPKMRPTKKEITQIPAIIDNFPDDLQAFLDAHGLKGKPGQDHFLLPLDGFKPLPPAKVVDGTVQLPENILLTYDLISPDSETKTKNDGTYSLSPNNFLYEPLKPEMPFELDTSSSETKETNLPYELPVRNSKSPTLDPIDLDSVKVIPLSKGISPISEAQNSNNDQSKRQTSEESSTEKTETDSTTTTEEPKTNAVSDSVSADTDTGASLTDLEDSFGGAGPSSPGDSQLPPPKKNGFYWMLDWNSFLEVGDGDSKINIRLEPKLGDPQMFLPVSVP